MTNTDKPKRNLKTPSREGRVGCPFWTTPEARLQLRHVVTDLGITSQQALTEALNDWFVKHNKHPIA